MFNSMTNTDRKALILKKMKAWGIGAGSGVPNKKYDGEEVIELINIANSFPELREKVKNYSGLFIKSIIGVPLLQ